MSPQGYWIIQATWLILEILHNIFGLLLLMYLKAGHNTDSDYRHFKNNFDNASKRLDELGRLHKGF